METSVVSLPGDRWSGELVRAALGSSSLIGGIHDVPGKEMVDEVRASLSYAGDAGAGPGSDVVQSTRFNTLLDTLTADLQRWQVEPPLSNSSGSRQGTRLIPSSGTSHFWCGTRMSPSFSSAPAPTEVGHNRTVANGRFGGR